MWHVTRIFTIWLTVGVFSIVPTFLFAQSETRVFDAGLGEDWAPEPPLLRYANAAAVLDYETGELLFEFRADRPWAPASLTKLVTVYTALDAIETGAFDLDVPVPVHPEAYASAMAPGSSLMFLGPDQVVSGSDLLRGLLISSGNDAATEVALRVSGSVSRFARRMNETVAAVGCPSCYFEEPAGLSAGNRITAAAFARFAKALIDRWPEILPEYASLRSFTYPQRRHYTDGTIPGASITQQNRNTLVGSYEGADGLKTGFIEESGYNLVATAERDGRRLIVIILGVTADSHTVGGRRREEDARELLDWGFDRYRRIEFPTPELSEVRVWGGIQDRVAPTVLAIDGIVVPTSTVSDIERHIAVRDDIWAPVAAGEEIGTVRYTVADSLIAESSVVVTGGVSRSGPFQRIGDRILWWWRQRNG